MVSWLGHEFDVGRLNPEMAGIWSDYLHGQKGSWEAMMREHGQVENENRLLENEIRALEGELLELQRRVNENDSIIKAGARLQPTTLQQPLAYAAQVHEVTPSWPPSWPPVAAASTVALDAKKGGGEAPAARTAPPSWPPSCPPSWPPVASASAVALDVKKGGGEVPAAHTADAAGGGALYSLAWSPRDKTTSVVVAAGDHGGGGGGVPGLVRGGHSGFSSPQGDNVAVPSGTFRLEHAISIHPSEVHGVAVHANSGLIATASWDCTVKLFDLSSKTVVKTLGATGEMTGGLYAVAFSKTRPDILGCTSADSKVYLWNHNAVKLEGVLSGHTDEVNGIDFHATQEVIATASDDCSCIVWDAAERRMVRTLGQHAKAVYGCAFMGTESPYLVATCSFDHNTRIFDMRDREMLMCLQTHQDEIVGIDYSSSRQCLSTGSDDGSISIVCARQRRLLAQIPVRSTHPDNEVKRVRFSPCGNLIAAACSSGNVLVYKVSESNPTLVASLDGHADCVFDVAWGISSCGARLLFSASHDHSCGYWKEVL